MQLADWPGGRTDFETVLAIKSDKIARFNRGLCSAHLKDWATALPDFDVRLSVDRDHVLAHYWRGRCRLALGDTHAAIPDLDHAIRLDRDPEFRYWRAPTRGSTAAGRTASSATTPRRSPTSTAPSRSAATSHSAG
jgi:tetratricopeptide (TPR) repeat protein